MIRRIAALIARTVATGSSTSTMSAA